MIRQLRALLVSLFFLFACSLGFAQSAQIQGQVSDSSGALIPKATVRVVNQQTGTERKAATNGSGQYSVVGLDPSVYKIFVQASGFSTAVSTPITLNVAQNAVLDFKMQVGSEAQNITVDGSGLQINTTDASVSTVIDRHFVENIPLNGRSFQDLISMTPGVVSQSPQSGTAIGSSGDFSINGQRTESNYYTVDGVAGNNLAGNGYGSSTGPGISGSLASATALGTTQSLISVDALQEFRIESSTYSAEFGRTPGGQISLATRSGTKDFHGSAFDYLRNNFFDANDWFNDHYGDPIAALRQNDFGATFGGPVYIPHIYDGKNKTFVFASYEGLRLTQPQAASIQYVPDTYLRQQAPVALQPLLNAFPIQNGTDYGNAANPSLAQFFQSYSLPSKIDSTSIRGDHELNSHLSLFFRYSYTPSSTTTRSLSSLSTNAVNAQTFTFGATSSISSQMTNQLRLGYSRSDGLRNGQIDSFGGATPLDVTAAMAQGSHPSSEPLLLFSFAGIGATDLFYAQDAKNRARQWNLVDTFSIAAGSHQFKFGLDYRRIKSPTTPAALTLESLFFTPASILSNSPLESIATNNLSSTPIFNETAAFAQDEWKVRNNLTLSLGIRWEVDPPPTEAHGNDAYTVLGDISNPASLQLAPRGTALWKTSWYNFAPRLGLAWAVRDTPNWETVFRTGVGVFFDTNNENAAQGYSGLGTTQDQVFIGAPLPLTQAQVDFPVTTSAPYNDVIAYPTHLQAPYTLQWNVSLEQELGHSQTATLSYVGANGRRLIGEEQLDLTGINPNFQNVGFPIGGLTSNYQALQIQFQRSVAKGFHALASYTWSHSIDFGSNSNALPESRGDSDYDVRNNFVGGISWDLPMAKNGVIVRSVLGHWGLDGRFTARTAFPITLQGNYLTDPLNGSTFYGNVDLVPNTPVYIYGSQYPGGRSLNPAAFTFPNGNGAGDAPRNFTRGFGETQVNLAARREFPLYEQVSLQFRAEAFNLLNHPNFGNVDPTLTDATFGQATQMLNQSLGTVASQYQQGGPRSMQFALKLIF
jgi:Carboxypeptidase regulatory-like domain